jgi:ferredoxin-NADP reductase
MGKLKLLEKNHLTDNVWSFVFEAHPQIHWTAGMFIRVELKHNNPDPEGTKRWFTVSAAPFEGHPQITTRITESTFKQALVAVPTAGRVMEELLPNLRECLVYVSGPEPMVEAIGDQLREMGMPDANLKQDFFPNYTEKTG